MGSTNIDAARNRFCCVAWDFEEEYDWWAPEADKGKLTYVCLRVCCVCVLCVCVCVCVFLHLSAWEEWPSEQFWTMRRACDVFENKNSTLAMWGIARVPHTPHSIFSYCQSSQAMGQWQHVVHCQSPEAVPFFQLTPDAETGPGSKEIHTSPSFIEKPCFLYFLSRSFAAD